MWKIKHIFDGDYGCEDVLERQENDVTVTLVNELGEQITVLVDDAVLIAKGLAEGDVWYENIVPSPLYRDPIYDAATDPTLIWNHKEKNGGCFILREEAHMVL